MRLRVLLADDEPLVRERLRALLALRHDVDLVAECGDGLTALQEIQRHQPDVVLLDVQMPELDGFDVVDALSPEERPAVVFVTAYDEYAVRAFGVNAVDYLMKPIQPHRLSAALDRAAVRIAGPGPADGPADAHGRPAEPPVPQLDSLLREIRALRGYSDRIAVRDGSRVTFVRVQDIDRVEAAGNYVRIHTGATSLLVRETLRAMEARLDPDRFLRIHRSLIVNLDRIAHAEPHFHGEYVLTLRDGTRLTSSRSYSARLRSLIEP